MKKKWTNEQLIIAVAKCTSIQEVLNELNLIGGHSRILDKIAELNLSTEHWRSGVKGRVKKTIPKLESLLVNGIIVPTTNLRKRLLSSGTFQNKCAICKITKWQGKPITIQLDHINGDRKDNRLENLRMLCPNCHSQTETFTGRNTKGKRRKNDSEYIRYYCNNCSVPLLRFSNKHNLCKKCRSKKYSGKFSAEQILCLQSDHKNKIGVATLLAKYNITKNTFYRLLKLKEWQLLK